MLLSKLWSCISTSFSLSVFLRTERSPGYTVLWIDLLIIPVAVLFTETLKLLVFY